MGDFASEESDKAGVTPMNQTKVQAFTHFIQTTGNTFISRLRRSRTRKTLPTASCKPSILSDPLPFAIPEEYVVGGRKLDFGSARDPYLPAIYEVDSHPRIPKDIGKDVIKHILIIPWPKGDALYLKFYFHYCQTKIIIPGGRNTTIPALVSDIVFTRDITGSGDGEHDSFEVFVGDIDEESSEGQLIKKLRDVILGPEADRCTNSCTAFEKCSKRANPVGGSGRCYNCALSHQKPRNHVTPAVRGKIRGELSKDEEEHIEMRHNLVSTTIRVAVNMFRRILPAEYKILDDACELNNVPRIGTNDNALYQGVQLNISQLVHLNGAVDHIEALAFFGGKHFDQNDSPGGWTTMISYPDIPTGDGWEGGRFHLVEFGLYVELDGLKSMTFTGLRLHSGTPPLPPTGVPIPPSAYRFVVVLYPQGATLDGKVNMNIAASPTGFPVQLKPAMRDATPQSFPSEDDDFSTPEEEYILHPN
ncbi:hypothetical protein EV368DRAFT_87994 [Lentinula lateritia]|nr:hypothetical protein EV368DRAFT_87994 [Lentinula lateritia]